MSKRKIESALKIKGIKARTIEYVRGEPTPSGYASGWNVEIEEETEDLIFIKDSSADASEFMEFESTSEVLRWIKQLPNLKEQPCKPN